MNSAPRNCPAEADRWRTGLFAWLICAVGSALMLASSAGAGTTHNFYDAQGRLIGVTTDHSQFASYSHDAADNRTSVTKAYAPPPVNSQSLAENNFLFQEQALVSADGRFVLTLQIDGNLVLYGPNGVLWAAYPPINTGSMLETLGDGRIILFDPQLNVVWQGGASGNPHAYLAVQTDGNVVEYTPDGTAVWSTGTCCH